MNDQILNRRIIIVGAGLNGLLTSVMLAQNNIPVTIIEKQSLNLNSFIKSDGRALAITNLGYNILKKYDIFNDLEMVINPIERIHITDQYCPTYLHFNNEEVENQPLGFMIDAHDLHQKLKQVASTSKNIEILTEETITAITNTCDDVTFTTNKGKTFKAELLIACDGKKSFIREQVGLKVHFIDYHQTAIVCNVKHEFAHDNVAQEMFLEPGPFAILPLSNNRSGIVWTERPELAKIFLTLPEDEFMFHLSKRFTDYLGKLTLDSKVFAYPLQASIVPSYYKHRVCLLGDSAHLIHPIAGQGFNQGIFDAESLVNILLESQNLRIGIGESALKKYQNSRKFDNLSMTFFTHLTEKMFSSDNIIKKALRRTSLGLINKIPPLTKQLMTYAMGKRYY
jgi:2-octaprenyl-6-methoxyphenol hydroxylase